MIDADRRDFAEILTATMQVYGAQLGTAAIGIWWAALSCYTLAQVRAGLSAHVTDKDRGRFAPKPADVIAQLSEHDGRPGVEEAWAGCPFTEAVTVVWTAEMRTAWAVALPLLQEGDAIAARMAFKEAYQRAVDEARRTGDPVEWEVSPGHHVIGREKPILRALELGRITPEHARELLPAPENLEPMLALPASANSRPLGDAIKNLAASMRQSVAKKEAERRTLPVYGEEWWKARQQPKPSTEGETA